MDTWSEMKSSQKATAMEQQINKPKPNGTQSFISDYKVKLNPID